jgi:predicted nucleotidyltransferase
MKATQIVDAVSTILHQHLTRPYKLFLFGSRATGNSSEGSDFDFLVDAGDPIEYEVWAKIKSDIDEIPTLYDIDITDLHRAAPNFLETISEDLIDFTQRKTKA